MLTKDHGPQRTAIGFQPKMICSRSGKRRIKSDRKKSLKRGCRKDRAI